MWHKTWILSKNTEDDVILSFIFSRTIDCCSILSYLLLRFAARSRIISGSILQQQRQWPCPRNNEDSLLVRFYLKERVLTNFSEQVLNCFWAFQEFNFPSVVPVLYKLIESTSTVTPDQFCHLHLRNQHLQHALWQFLLFSQEETFPVLRHLLF